MVSMDIEGPKGLYPCYATKLEKNNFNLQLLKMWRYITDSNRLKIFLSCKYFAQVTGNILN